jgi:hypothetical protein
MIAALSGFALIIFIYNIAYLLRISLQVDDPKKEEKK